MERFTTNKEVEEMTRLELAFNSCYAQDGRARYRDYTWDVDAREMTRQLLISYASETAFNICGEDVSDEEFDDFMYDCLQYGTDIIEGVIALLYRNLWAMAELRERLKYYEDLEEQGCKIEK